MCIVSSKVDLQEPNLWRLCRSEHTSWPYILSWWSAWVPLSNVRHRMYTYIYQSVCNFGLSGSTLTVSISHSGCVFFFAPLFVCLFSFFCSGALGLDITCLTYLSEGDSWRRCISWRAVFSLLSSMLLPLSVSSREAICLLNSSTVAVSFSLARQWTDRCKSFLLFTLEEVILALQKFYQSSIKVTKKEWYSQLFKNLIIWLSTLYMLFYSRFKAILNRYFTGVSPLISK